MSHVTDINLISYHIFSHMGSILLYLGHNSMAILINCPLKTPFLTIQNNNLTSMITVKRQTNEDCNKPFILLGKNVLYLRI